MRLILSAGLALLFTSTVSAATLEEFDAARADLQALAEQVPLTQRATLFLTEPSKGYGLYKERENAVFAQGEPIISYVEPVGYGWAETPEGLFAMAFDVDLKVLLSDGSVVSEKPAFLQYRHEGHDRNLEFSMDLTLTLNGAPAGMYAVEYTVKDLNGGEQSTFRQDFEIAE